MRKILYILLLIIGGLSSIAYSVSSHLMEDQRRYIAYTYLCVGIGLTLTGMVLGIIHILSEPKPVKPAEPRHTGRELKSSFGVFWDSSLNPLCPVCKTPLTLSRDKLIYRIDGGVPLPLPEPHCLKCGKVISLHDDEGNYLTLSEAKKRLSPKKAVLETKVLEGQKSEQRPDTEAKKLRDAREKLRTVRKRLPEGDIEEKYVLIYHQALTEIQQDTGRDMSRFRIPPNELKPLVGKVELSEEHYCDKGIFFITIDNAINSLKSDSPPIEHPPKLAEAKTETLNPLPVIIQASNVQPSPKAPGSYEPDKTAIKIFIQISKGIAYETELANVLNLETKEVRDRLGLLKEHDYITLHRPENRAPYFQVTQKGYDFLKKPHRIVPFGSGEPDEISIKILTLLADPKLPPYESEIASRLHLHPERAKHHLKLLVMQRYIYAIHIPGISRSATYKLDDAGRELLMRKGII
jgi:hypothetical protein